MGYKPRHPKASKRAGNKRQFKRYQPQANPPYWQMNRRTAAAAKIQSNWRKNRKMKATREVKSVEMTTRTYQLSHGAKGAEAMANGVVIPVGLMNTHMPNLTQGTGENDLLGVWHMPRYCVTRYIINFASLTAHAALDKGLEVRCRYGFIKNTGHKSEARLTSNNDWAQDINKLIHHELQSSGIDDNFLTFSKRNRAVHVLADFMIRPNLNHRVADTDSVNSDFAPPYNLQIDWHTKKGFPRSKQRLTSATDAFVPNNTWIGWVYFSSNNIQVADGDLDIHTSCKYYFSDP